MPVCPSFKDRRTGAIWPLEQLDRRPKAVFAWFALAELLCLEDCRGATSIWHALMGSHRWPPVAAHDWSQELAYEKELDFLLWGEIPRKGLF